jgi:2-haloacid dehalogenase
VARCRVVAGIDAVVFDVGGVLLDWDPRHLYRKLFSDDAAVERFLAETGLHQWHVLEHDHGRRPMTETIPEMCERFPAYAAEIAVWQDRFMENVGAVIDGTVEILDQLRGRVRLFALSNWPAETAADLRRTYEFFDWFDGIVISGEEQVAKPHPDVFHRLCDRHGVDPRASVFVDDVEANTTAADRLGFRSVLFSSPRQLRHELAGHGLLPTA